MTVSSSPLRIAILGSGKIGSAFAFQLALKGGHDVTVIARPTSLRLQQLERDQAIVDINGARAPVKVASRLDEDTPYDLVIVTLLAHQIGPLLEVLKRSSARCIQFMFNTFDPERLEAAIGPERCAFGMPFVQASLDNDGKLKAVIGAGGQKTIMSQERWVDLFKTAGLPAALEPDMQLWLRCHAPLCVAFEGVCVAGSRRRGGASWGEAFVVAKGVKAGFALIKTLGYEIYPTAKQRLSNSPSWILAIILWSISRVRSFRDLLATGEAECCALIDTMVSAAPVGGPAWIGADIKAMRPL